ncbi:MAG TPA: hypothetical protein PLF88_00240 [Opitutaceae bacterium]|nr:hypothetical protein [Opitutaceae bacterium]HRJ45743.1 hypothetical protein [Opitutaceae bacterium]
MRPSNPFAALDQPTPVPDRAASTRLYRFGLGGLIAVTLWFIWQNRANAGSLTLIGVVILALASLPILKWARDHRTWFPAFEIGMLTCIPFYAIPLLSGHAEIRHFSDEIVNQAGLLVVVYLGMANWGFAVVRRPVRPSWWAAVSLMPPKLYRYVPLGLLLNTVYLYIDTFTELIPNDFHGTLRALFFGLGTLCTFILARLWGMRILASGQIVFFAVNVALQLAFLFSQLYLIGGISLVALAFIAFSASRRRVPWHFLVLFLPVVSLLHLGKSDMRQLYWEEKRPPPTPLEIPAYFTEWIGYSFHSRDEREAGLGRQSTIFERASLIQMLCLAVERVPEQKPYLLGESYADIPALFIPRFLWPDKPSSLMSNIRLGIYFGLIDPYDPFKFSIAFGMIAEAYINYGFIGAAILGFIFGATLRRLSLLSLNVPQFSALGIFAILLTAWSFQAELVAATWLSSLFQASVVCIGLPLAYHRFSTR